MGAICTYVPSNTGRGKSQVSLALLPCAAGPVLAVGHLDRAFRKRAGEGPKRGVPTAAFLLKLLRPHHGVSS